MLESKRVTAYIPPQKRMLAGERAQAARTRCKSPPGTGAAIDRMTHGEGAIAELKLRHALDRARWRGTRKLQLQLLIAATAVNLKRLLSRPIAIEGSAIGENLAVRRDLEVIRVCLSWLRPDEASGSLTGS